jgi:dipeptidyl aminopeptidase/acylaminoacyl peptidase
MTGNFKRSVDTPRTIARLFCRAFMCAAGLAIAAPAAHGQTSPLAYRSDFYYLIDCEAGCALEVSSSLVTPWTTIFGASQPTWSPDGRFVGFTDGYNIYVIPATGGQWLGLTNATTDTFSQPAWSPDGRQIAFVRTTSESMELGVVNVDKSGQRTLSSTAGRLGHPAWSPDGARIAFTCDFDFTNVDICVINRDGTGLVRLTNNPAGDWSPVWSPDGTKIAFSTDRFGGGGVLALMNADGSGVSQIGAGIRGWPESWSSDGAHIAFTTFGEPQELCGGSPGGTSCATFVPYVVYAVTPDGAVVTPLVPWAGDPAWMPSCNPDPCAPTEVPIIVIVETTPTGLHVTVDGVTSPAPRVFYWIPGSSHTIATDSLQSAGGIRNVFARWSDGGAISHSVAPTTGTTFTANFNTQYLLTTGVSPAATGSVTASPSSADGFYASGASVQLTATPNAGFTFVGFSGALAGVTNPQFLVMNAPKTVIANFSSPMHIGDLDGARTNQQNAWTAAVTITLHDGKHGPVANATVSGSWGTGETGVCTTDSTGRCVVSKSAIHKSTKSVAFTMVSATSSKFFYGSADNHDPDGDSNGTSVTVSNR